MSAPPPSETPNGVTAVSASRSVSADHLTGPGVMALEPGMRGRWLVTTQGTHHIWDLEALTYTRIPGADSHAGAMVHDCVAHLITRVTWWPRVGSVSLVWFDDPDRPTSHEQWRRSSRIKSIEPLAEPPGSGTG